MIGLQVQTKEGLNKHLEAKKGSSWRFTSKELDEETGLYYYGARYYEPTSSRWMSADPAGFGLANPNRKGYSVIESLNWYSYVSNNPVKYVDPTGMFIFGPRGFIQLFSNYIRIPKKDSTDSTSSSSSSVGSYQYASKSLPGPGHDFSNYDYPVESGVLTSAFGKRDPVQDKDSDMESLPNHQGIDIASEMYTPIYSSEEGTITDITYDEIYGHSVTIDHGDGIETRNSHLAEPSMLEKDQNVPKGSLIGYMGESGLASGPHTHWEITANGKHIDPSTVISRPDSITLGAGVSENSLGVIRNE